MLDIISKIGALQVEINKTLNGTFKNLVYCQLNKSLMHLNDSIKEYEKENYFNAVILDKLAKINLLMSEIFVWIGEFTCQIDDEFSKYVISSLNSIRNCITTVMGKIIDTPSSIEIAQIEINISNIADDLYDYSSTSLIDAILINVNLWQCANSLDLTLINLIDGNLDETSDCIQQARNGLKRAICMISLLNWIGSITNEDAQTLKGLIQFQNENLKNYI